MRYYPRVECLEKIVYPKKELQLAIVEQRCKVICQHWIHVPMKRKVTFVMEIPIREDDAVYMDVMTGDIYDDFNSLKQHPERNLYADSYVVASDTVGEFQTDELIDIDEIYSYLIAAHRHMKQRGKINKKPNAYMRNSGDDLIGRIFTSDDFGASGDAMVMDTELIQREIEDDIIRLRETVQKPHVETLDLFYAISKDDGREHIVRPLLTGFQDINENLNDEEWKGEYQSRDFQLIQPFYSLFEEVLDPVITPNQAYRLLKEAQEKGYQYQYKK